MKKIKNYRNEMKLLNFKHVLKKENRYERSKKEVRGNKYEVVTEDISGKIDRLIVRARTKKWIQIKKKIKKRYQRKINF